MGIFKKITGAIKHVAQRGGSIVKDVVKRAAPVVYDIAQRGTNLLSHVPGTSLIGFVKGHCKGPQIESKKHEKRKVQSTV